MPVYAPRANAVGIMRGGGGGEGKQEKGENDVTEVHSLVFVLKCVWFIVCF